MNNKIGFFTSLGLIIVLSVVAQAYVPRVENDKDIMGMYLITENGLCIPIGNGN